MQSIPSLILMNKMEVKKSKKKKKKLIWIRTKTKIAKMTIHKNNNNRLMTFSLRQIPILNLKLIIKINNKTIMLKMKTLNIKAVTMSNNNKNNLLIQRKKKKKKEYSEHLTQVA